MMKLDGEGQAIRPAVFGTGILDFLGVEHSIFEPSYPNANWGNIKTSEITVALDALARTLFGNNHRWTGLDLRKTAAATYARLGEPNLDLADTLVPRE